MAVQFGAGPALAAALLCAPMLLGCSPHETPADIVEAPNDVAVDAAMRDAVKSLGVFWAKFDAREAGLSDYTVKLAMKAKGGGTELIWAEPISHSDTEVVARLLNDPVYLADVEYGSVVHVSPDLVVDWAYTKASKAYGHYTTRALKSRFTPEQRAETEGLLAPTPLEPSAS